MEPDGTDAFWNNLSPEEKQKVADKVYEWAISWTCTHNWRYFNVMMLTFLDYYGYKTDKTLLIAHLDNILLHYVGDGWYRDHSYDYYSVHVFHLFNAVWAEKYGGKFFPDRVEIIRQHQKEFCETYPLIFSREGHINMYGRSILYRLGASAGMPALFIGDNTPSSITPGEARRIASASLLQFVTHPKFFHQGIPSLGFYGPFEPCIQAYSVLPVHIDVPKLHCINPSKGSSLLTDKEEMGHWGGIEKDEVFSKYSYGMGMFLSNHGSTGTSELRPGKSITKTPITAGLYTILHFLGSEREDGIASSDLTLLLVDYDDKAKLPIHVDAAGYRNNVLYRQAAYEYTVINILFC